MSGLTLAERPLSLRALPLGGGGSMLVGGTPGVPAGIASAAWIGATDVLSLLAMVFALPFVILGIGMPIVLIVQVLLWLGRLL